MGNRKLRNMELDILRTVRDHGPISFIPGSTDTEGTKELLKLYPDENPSDRAILMDFVKELISTGHLLAGHHPQGSELPFYTRGLTPKGVGRLYELAHPVRAWFERNWLAAIVAAVAVVSAAASVASTIVNLLVKLN